MIEISEQQVKLSKERLTIVWNKHRGEWQFHAGGGVFCKTGGRAIKLSEMMEGAYVITDPQGKEHPGGALSFSAEGESVRASLSPVTTGSLTWSGIARWSIDERGWIVWRYEITPSAPPAEEYLVSVHLNMLPSRWRTNSLGSCVGYFGDLAYALHPTPSCLWWPRMQTEKMLRNVHVPVTIKPTRRVREGEVVVLEGILLADELSPRELNLALRSNLQPKPLPPNRPLEATLAAAFTALKNNVAGAKATGHLAEDEAAFLNLCSKKAGWLDREVFGAGFTCSFGGHAILPLLEYAQWSSDGEARDVARALATWIARHVQTACGAFHDNFNMRTHEGFDFIGEDYVYPHTTAKIAENLLAAAEEFGNRDLLASGIKACDWLLSLQEDNGAIPWKLVASTGASDGTEAQSVSAASSLSAWVRAHRSTEDPKYLEGCLRLADWVEEAFIRTHHFAGYITDDHPGNGWNRWETPSATPGSYAVDGLLDLHEHTREPRYLDLALEAAHIQLLWQWLWQPEDGLPRRILGSAQQASVWEYTLKQTLGGENLYMVWNYQRLYDLTGDELWRTAAEMGLYRAEDDQVYDPDDIRHGALSEGLDLNLGRDISFQAEDPHVNYLGVSYLVRTLVRHLYSNSGEKAPEDPC